ncbi:MAG: transglutaminase domain-containing protein [Planctomycetes bacterium]|nr:transglutaminase domain-containing protein [Planctomycetota bacterium]
MRTIIAITLIAATSLVANAQDESAVEQTNGIKFDKKLVQRWKVGMTITAPAGPCAGIYGTATVPTDWPEQQVRLVEEDFSAEVKDVAYRTLDNGVKQMLISIPMLNPGQEAHAFVTFEVTRSSILGPDDPTQFKVPKRVPRDIGKFLAPSPKIESRHGKIRTLARELAKDQDSAWGKVESMYDWVRENVEYVNGPLKGALAALNDGTGDCEELTSLFVALCRANKIPARTVWIPGHCYPEFYLHDSEGVGHWIPCQAAGTRDFGSMPDFRPILQKGDNFRVPEKKAPQRYVAEFLKVKAIRGGGKPQVQFVRQLLDGE